MKASVISVCLAIALLHTPAARAQEPDAHKKEMKMDKKSARAMKDDQKGNSRKGNKKDEKGLKKSAKIDKREEKGKYDK
jgi:hypothetical protein